MSIIVNMRQRLFSVGFVNFGALDAYAQEAWVPPPHADIVEQEPPLAGFHNGLFYLRDKEDVFRLYVQGHVHIDADAWLGPGVDWLDASNALRPTFFLRRARPEIGG